MRKYLLLFLMCVVSMTIYAQEPEYYIEGDITIRRVVKDGKPTAEFVLHNPIEHGIYFDPPAGDSIIAEDAGSGTKQFVFYNAETDCVEGLDRDPLPLNFYRQQPNGEWQKDSETRAGTAHRSKTSWTTILLVLDHTYSLKQENVDGLKIVKANAIKFVRDLAAQDNSGSVHIGVVGFADQPEILSIMPLTDETKPRIEDFINKFQYRNNTYLYHAMDEAISLINNYQPIGKTWDKCQGISMITFTDGFDNGSINVEKDLMTNDKYFSYLSQRVKDKLHGHTMENYMIFVKGNDVKEESSYVDNLKQLSSSESHFLRITHVRELQEQFAYILSKLTVRFTDLTCYIPQHRGRVRWVLDCGEPKPTKEPKKPSAYMSQLGFILGANNGITGKGYATDKHFAYEFDASCNLYTYSLDFLSNYMYQNVAHQGKKSDMHWYIGGGASLGYSLGYIHETYDYHEQHWADWRIGANAIIGLEWIFRNSPFVLSLDYRPGIQYFIGWDCDALYFDYLNLNLGLRWYF